MNKLQTTIFIICLTLTNYVMAGDDPSIKGNQRINIKTAMGLHINQNTINGKYVIYDAVKGELKHLELAKLHEGIVKKGDFYVSCADFVDSAGKVYDLDFLVTYSDNDPRVVQSIVHSADNKKRKYHVEG